MKQDFHKKNCKNYNHFSEVLNYCKQIRSPTPSPKCSVCDRWEGEQ